MRTRTRVWGTVGMLGVGLLGAVMSVDRAEVVSATGAEMSAGAPASVPAVVEAAGETGVLRSWESQARMLAPQAPEGCPEWQESASSCRPFDVDPPRPPRIPLSQEVLDAALQGCAEAGGVQVEAQASWIRVPDCGMAWNARAVATPAPSPIYRDNPVQDGPPLPLAPGECLMAQEAEGLRLFLLPSQDPEGDPADGNIAGVADFRLRCCEDCGGEVQSER